jgi:uncharacterized protein
MDKLEKFNNQQYLNLETFRKNGQCMQTPVWFVEDGGTIYISTVANSGKVKRIRNNDQVNVAACKMNGKVIGEWTEARAREIDDPEIAKKANQLLDKKYGLMKKIFDKQRASKGVVDTILEIRLKE